MGSKRNKSLQILQHFIHYLTVITPQSCHAVLEEPGQGMLNFIPLYKGREAFGCLLCATYNATLCLKVVEGVRGSIKDE